VAEVSLALDGCRRVSGPSVPLTEVPLHWSCVGDRWSVVHWPLSLHGTSAEERVGQAHVHQRKREHPSSGKDPPKAQAVALKRHISAAAPFVRSVDGAISASKTVDGHCLARTLDASGTSLPSLRPITSSASSDGCNVLRLKDRKAHVGVSF